MVPAIDARSPPRRGGSGIRINKLGVVARVGRAGVQRDDTQCVVAPGERPSVSEGRTGVSRRTNDTRIFSTGESRRRRQEVEDREGVSGGLTEPPSPTEPIPSPSDRTPDRTGAGGHAGQGVAAGRTEPGPN